MVKAIDRSLIKGTKATDKAVALSSAIVHPTTGVVTVRGRLTRPGLLPYASDEHPSGRETIVYRSPSVVFATDYLNSIKGSLISPLHQFLDKTDPNAGLVTGAVREGDYVRVELMFTDQKALDTVMGGAREISAGYTYDYAPMNGSEVSRAKSEYPEDWTQIQKQLRSPDRAFWISASNLKNNHVAPVIRGRAGSACSLDRALTMDETLGQAVSTEGVLPETAAEETTEDAAMSKMIEEILGLVLKLQASAIDSGIPFDGKAFAADRAGYLETLLKTVGVKAKDATLSMATDLVVAYSQGYQAGKTASTLPAAATDKATGKDSITIAPVEPTEESSTGDLPRKAWDKFTRPISA